VREPDVPSNQLSTVGLELRVVVGRRRPRRRRMRFRVEVPTPLVAVAHRHLAAEFDELTAFSHLSEDTADSERS